MVKGFDFSREAFETCMEDVVSFHNLLGMYDVTATMMDRGKSISDRVYFIPFDSVCNLVIYSTVDVFTDRSPVESTSRWEVEMYWVFENVNGSCHKLFRKLGRTDTLFEGMIEVIEEAVGVYDKIFRDGSFTLEGFNSGFPYE